MPILEGRAGSMCLKFLDYLGTLLNVICICLYLSCGKCSFKQKFSVAPLSIVGTPNFCSVGSLVIKIAHAAEKPKIIESFPGCSSTSFLPPLASVV